MSVYLCSSIWVSLHNFCSCLSPFRAWAQGLSREAGSWQEDAVQTGITKIGATRFDTAWETVATADGNVRSFGGQILVDTLTANIGVKRDWQFFESLQRVADKTRPVNVALPIVIYLGSTA